jgi:hypothetical protein
MMGITICLSAGLLWAMWTRTYGTMTASTSIFCDWDPSRRFSLPTGKRSQEGGEGAMG